MRSVNGHALPIDELKGTKPVESIDLSGKKLGHLSGIIIAACIKDNAVLKELKCAAALCMHTRVNGPLRCRAFFCRSLRENYLGPKGGAALADGLKGNTTLRTLE